jgi:ribonuclease BN (tRNA processing enzyme)
MNTRLVVILGLIAMLMIAWVAAFALWRAAEIGEQVAPLEPRRFDSLTLIAVGTGSDHENPVRLGPATAIGWEDHVVLVDAGRGVAESLRRSGLPVTQPRRVYLTNLLPENTVGLDDLLATGWLQDRETPLVVIGPAGTGELVEHLLAAHRAGLAALGRALPLPPEGGRIVVTEVGDGYAEERGGVTIRAGALRGGPLPALAWRFERGRRVIVVSGTGWARDDLVAFAQGADLLVHDAVYVPPAEAIEEAGVMVDPERLEAERAIHTAIESVGSLAADARVDGLVLTRLRPPPFFASRFRAIVGEQFDGDVYIPEDGDEIVP